MPTRLSRYAEALMEAAWLAAIILVPVFFNVYSSRIFEPDKITLLRSLALVTLGAWVVKLVEEGRPRWQVLEPGASWFKALLRIPLLPQAAALALVYLVATIFSVTPSTSLWGSYQRLQGTYTTLSYLVIFAALVGTLRRREQVDRLVTTLILCSLPVAFYGFLQRYEIDPIPWGGNTVSRIASNMGNSIFVAAYLIMVWPLTMARVIEAFQAILKAEKRLPLHITRATLYLTLALLQPIAMYFTFSRGPMLGFAASALFMFLLVVMLLLPSRRQRLAIISALVVLGLAGAGLLITLNIENGPLESLRAMPGIGRFGQILNPESNNALVRKYIWEGAADLVAPHDPIEFPDGSKDTFNFLRPLIGYGPESMYVAYNPFYVPDLGHVEKRNASPDRSHNETWDALVITGALGFIMYLVVFMSVFYYGLKWLGLVDSKAQKALFWGTSLGGGALGAGLLIAWGGIEWFGVGLPFGIAIGLVFVYLPLAAFTRYRTPESPEETARILLLIALLTAVMAHFLEINFGIAIAVTRTYFWVFSGLLLLVGFILPKRGVYALVPAQAAGAVPENIEANAAESPGAASSTASHAARRRKSPVQSSRIQRRSAAAALEPWLREALIGGLALAVLISALGFNYVSNPNRQTSILKIISASLTELPNRNDITSYGVLGLVLLTIVVGVLILAGENPHVKDWHTWNRAAGVTLGSALAGGLIFWLWHAGVLAGLAGLSPSTADQLLMQVERIGSMLTNFYIWVFLLLVGVAYLLGSDQPVRGGQKNSGLVVAAAMLLVVGFLVVRTNLRIILADITFKMAEPFAKGDTWGVASLLYARAISLAPDEDYYYLFLGRSYLEQAKTLENEDEKAALVERAEVDLQIAQRINPLNTDHTANLARLFSWWASQAGTEEDRASRGEKSNSYYARALTLSPQNSTLWGEWSILLLDILDQPQAAFERLQRALALDESYSFTQGLMGDYYMQVANTALNNGQEFAVIKGYLESAVGHYNEAARLEASSRVQYLLSAANAYLQMASLSNPPDPETLSRAIAIYQQALESKPRVDDQWRILEQMARVSVQMFDQANALDYANRALQLAPENERERLNQLVQQILQLP